MSMEAQEVADLPDFLNGQSNQKPKQSAAEMLAEIKRKEELKRVNEKFGKQGIDAPQNNRNETILQKTTNLMDEEELLLLIDREDRAANKANKNRDSECLNSLNLLSGGLKDMKVDQKELDSDEMREEMKDDESEDNPHMV